MKTNDQEMTNKELQIWIAGELKSFQAEKNGRTDKNVRQSRNFRDAWELNNNGNIYDANKPNSQTLSLSPLLSSSNPKDIKSVAARIPSGSKTNITFAASASRTISHFLMRDTPSLMTY